MKKTLTSIFFLLFGGLASVAVCTFVSFALAVLLRCIIRAWKLGWTICLYTLCASLANATPVLFSMQSLTGTANNRTIVVQPDRPQNPLVLGTNLIPIFDLTLQPVGGQVITNLQPWGYTIKVDGWPRSAHIVVTNTTATINAANLINTNAFAPLNIYPVTIYTNNGPVDPTNLPSIVVTNNADASLNTLSIHYGYMEYANGKLQLENTQSGGTLSISNGAVFPDYGSHFAGDARGLTNLPSIVVTNTQNTVSFGGISINGSGGGNISGSIAAFNTFNGGTFNGSGSGLNNVHADTVPASGVIGTLTNNTTGSAAVASSVQFKPINGIRVEDYGASSFYTNKLDSGFNGHTLPDSTAAIQAALNAAAAAQGNSNNVYFGAGIYRITTNLLVGSKVNIWGVGQLHDGRGGIDAVTNGWTIIWVDNLKSDGVVFINQNQASSSIRNIEVNGYINPLSTTGDFLNASTNQLANGVGVFVTAATNLVNAGGFYDDHLAVHGFRVGMWCQNNNIVHDYQDHSGNDVGFVSWGNFGSPYTNDLTYSNLFNAVFSLWKTNYQPYPANADNQIFNVPNGGMRQGGLEYMLGDSYGFTINQEGEQQLTMFGIFASTELIIHDCLCEFDRCATNYVFGCTNTPYHAAMKFYFSSVVDIIHLEGGSVEAGITDLMTNWVVMDCNNGSWSGRFDTAAHWSLGTWMNTGRHYLMRGGSCNGIFSGNGQDCIIDSTVASGFQMVPDFMILKTGWDQISVNFAGNFGLRGGLFFQQPTIQQTAGLPDYQSIIYSPSAGTVNSSNLWVSRYLWSDPVYLTNYYAANTTPPPLNFTMNALAVTNGVITNGGVAWLFTNGVPTMSLPNGSFATGTGQIYTRTNNAWVAVGGSGATIPNGLVTNNASAAVNISNLLFVSNSIAIGNTNSGQYGVIYSSWNPGNQRSDMFIVPDWITGNNNILHLGDPGHSGTQLDGTYLGSTAAMPWYTTSYGFRDTTSSGASGWWVLGGNQMQYQSYFGTVMVGGQGTIPPSGGYTTTPFGGRTDLNMVIMNSVANEDALSLVGKTGTSSNAVVVYSNTTPTAAISFAGVFQMQTNTGIAVPRTGFVNLCTSNGILYYVTPLHTNQVATY